MKAHSFSNAQVAKLLKQVAAGLSLSKTNPFEIRAYQNAADSIEHADNEILDLWEEGKLGDLPGLGKSMQTYLDELFRTGKVKHFESVMGKYKPVIFELIELPGIGPKTAKEIADLGVKDLKDLQKQLANGKLVEKGFSAKIAEKLKLGLETKLTQKGEGRERMLLPIALVQAEKIMDYIKKCSEVKRVDPLGSLRRRVVTVGDLDFSACGDDPGKIIEHFIQMPEINRVLNKGPRLVMVELRSGLHVDLLVDTPDNYGAILHHFTSGKNHNIHLRNIALSKGLSISADGVRRIKNSESRSQEENELIKIREEGEIYEMLGMDYIPPEMREDIGEIELAIAHKIPKLVELKDVKGDFHLHSNFDFNQSHGPGLNTLEEMVKKGASLGYQYLALSDHAPAMKNSKAEIIKLVEKRTLEIDRLKHKYTNSVRVLNSLEVDILPDGTLSVPDEALATMDVCNIGVHSLHTMEKEKMTLRILKSLDNPYAKILVHPTGRRLLSRSSYDADWEQIFKKCAEKKIALEVNGTPDRLDLRDDLIRMASKLGCKFVVNTDAHELAQMDNMRFGVDLARRGWLESKQIVNTWEWKKVKEFFEIKD